MRRTFVVVAIAGAVIAAVAPSAGAQEPEDPDAEAGEAELVLSVGGQVAPKAVSVDKAPSGPNPYLALVPDPAALDYSGWERYADRPAPTTSRWRRTGRDSTTSGRCRRCSSTSTAPG